MTFSKSRFYYQITIKTNTMKCRLVFKNSNNTEFRCKLNTNNVFFVMIVISNYYWKCIYVKCKEQCIIEMFSIQPL